MRVLKYRYNSQKGVNYMNYLNKRNNNNTSIFGDSFFDLFKDSDFDNKFSHLMRTDIKETDKEYVFQIEVPGFTKENIKMNLEDGYLNIEAVIEKNTNEEGKYLRKERYYGSVSRSFYVGEDVTEEDVHANMNNGVLTISINKNVQKKEKEKKYISIN